jgi:hypothetical protein
MGLLAPLFLVGLLAIGLPLWLHRLQTQSSDRKPFSSAMLLETAEQQVHVKKKLKYLLLLAARIVLLGLLALAFAKPFITRPPVEVASTDAGTTVVLVDTSASMGRVGVFPQALSSARQVIDDAPADALIQVIAADADARLQGTLSNDRDSARGALAALSPSELRLDVGEVMTAIERLAAGLPPPVALHFVSDFQASAMPVRFSDAIPAGVASFMPHVVGTGEPFNWSISYVRDSANGIDVGLNGSGDRERVGDVELLVNGAVVEARGLSQTGPLALRFDAPAYEDGENRLELRINSDDDFAADNTWYHVVDNSPPDAVPLITLNTGGLPVTYLSAALESAGRYRVEPLIAGDFDTRVLTRYRWAVVDDIGLADPQLEAALSDFVASGGNLLAFAGDRAAAMETLPVTGHRPGPLATGAQPGDFLSVGQVDSRHPALTRTEGWPSVTVTRNLPLEAQDGDDVLIRLSNNEPFLLERQSGAGRILLVTAALDNRWNDLPVRPVFVSFMIEAAGYLSGISEIPSNYTAGAVLPLSLAGASSGQVVDPDGNTVLSLADTTREQQIKLDRTGFYEVYTPQGETVIAANVDPRESDLRKVSQETLDDWQDATAGQGAAEGAVFSAEQEVTVELWHWVLLILALIVIGESFLGNMHLSPRRMGRA